MLSLNFFKYLHFDLIKIRNFTDWTNKVKDILGAKPKEALKCILDWKCGIIMN